MSTPTGDQGGQQYGGGQYGGQEGQYGQGQYPQGQYDAGQYGQAYPGGPGQPVAQPKNGFGTTALVLGIIGLILTITVVVFYVGGVLGIAAIVFGVLGMQRAKRGEATNRGMAIGGLVTGILAVLGAIVIGIITAVLVSAVSNSGYTQCAQQAGNDPVALQQCAEQAGQQLVGGN